MASDSGSSSLGFSCMAYVFIDLEKHMYSDLEKKRGGSCDAGKRL